MKISVIAVGKTATSYMSDALSAYLKRLSHYVETMLTEIPDVRGQRTPEAQKTAEGEAILRALRPGDAVVLLDERGREMTSVEFSAMLSKRMASGLKRLVFVIGGPYGFSREVYDRADMMLALSRMTFTHEMVRLFFVEQIYRAMTIMRGEPYHHV